MIDLLRKQGRRWRKSRKTSALNHFLRTVYGLHATWYRNDLAKCATDRIAELVGLSDNPARHAFRTLIEAGLTVDRRVASRWTRALRFAWIERKRFKSLEHCLRRSGGLAGAANEWATLQAALRASPYVISDMLDR